MPDYSSERLEAYAVRCGFVGIEWTTATIELPFIISPENKVRIPDYACNNRALEFDLYGMHDILHAKQILTGRLQQCSRQLYVWEDDYYEVARGDWPSAKNLRTGEWHCICPWEDDAMRFDQ